MFRRDFVAHLTAAIVSFFAAILGRGPDSPKRVLFGKGKPYEKWITLQGAEPNPWWHGWIKINDGGPLFARRSGQPNIALAIVETGHDRLIRWIPVSERLPTWPESDVGDGVKCRGWTRVLVVTKQDPNRVVVAHFSDGYWAQFGTGERLDVTNWAEFPAPPQVAAPPLPEFKNFTTQYTTADKQTIIDAVKKAVGLKFKAPRS